MNSKLKKRLVNSESKYYVTIHETSFRLFL